MVVLNLRDFSVPLSTNFGRGMTDKRFLELEITEWLRSPERKKQLAGEHLWFVNAHFANTGKKSFDGTKVKIIFDRDVLINETEAINNCKASVGILSDETIVKMHPWVSDPEQELKRIKDEKEEAMADPYRAAFEQNRNPQQPGTVKDGEDGGKTE